MYKKYTECIFVLYALACALACVHVCVFMCVCGVCECVCTQTSDILVPTDDYAYFRLSFLIADNVGLPSI